LAFARNRLRHELLPQLTATWNPRLTEALAHLADLSYEEERWWLSPASPIEAIERNCDAGGIEMRADDLATLPRAVARRTIRRAIAAVKGDLRRVEFEHVESVLELASRNAGEGRIRLPTLDVQRSFDWLRLARPAAASKVEPVALTIPGSYRCPDGKSVLRLEIEGAREEARYSANSSGKNGADLRPFAEAPRQACATLGTVVGLNRIPGDLELRGWRPGDRYRPTGHARVRKLTEMFAEARIPSWLRPQWPMVMSGENILWARQFGVAAEYAADGQSGPILRISEVNLQGNESFGERISS
jgi:tRNA(Ile)-lysidine synthase